MTSTFGAASSRSSRRATRAARSTLFTGLLFAGACVPQKPAVQESPQKAPTLLVVLPVWEDSAVKLARIALGSLNGTIRAPQFERDHVVLSTQLMRERPMRGFRRITVIATVERQATPTDTARTGVEISAWAIDVQTEALRIAERVGELRPSTIAGPSPVSMNDSHVKAYPITPRDAEEWELLEKLADIFVVKHAAKRAQ